MVQGQRQGQGLVNWSSRIVEDKDFSRGQQLPTYCLIRYSAHVISAPLSRCVRAQRTLCRNTGTDDVLCDVITGACYKYVDHVDADVNLQLPLYLCDSL